MISDQFLLNTLNNHPVHLVDDKGKLASSALIPFCSLGNDIESMSIKTENFSLPVCNSFKAVVHRDQLCYQVDLEKFKKNEIIKEQLIYGLVLVLDYNEDRNILSSAPPTMDTENTGYISIDTISKNEN